MRCKFCGSTLIHSAHDHRNFSAGKAVAGTIVFGPLGAGAGMLGKDIEGFRCTQCGAFMEHPMDTMTEKMVNDAVYDAKKGTSYISYNFYKGQYPNIETVQVENRNNTERVSLHFSNNTKTVKAINVEKDTMKVKRSFTPNLWEPSCPVFIRSIIIKTGNSGDSLSFDIINQSEKTIRSLYLQATVLDDTGDEITTIQCVFQGENVDPGKTFSSDKAFTVGSDLAYKVEVVCEKASFADDSVWRAEDGAQAYEVELSAIKDFPRRLYLAREYNKILEERGVVQRDKRGRYIKMWRPEYLPIKNESNGYWTCTCGMPVKIKKSCPVCKCSYEELQKIFSQDYLAKIQHDAVLQRASERALETAGFREKLDKEIEEKKAADYEKALAARELKSIPQLTIAVGLLDGLGDYKDAKKVVAEYRSRLEELKAEEEKKKQEERILHEKQIQEEAARRKKEREEKEAAEEVVRKRNRKIGRNIAVILVIGIAVYGLLAFNNHRKAEAEKARLEELQKKYEIAESLLEDGKYDEAEKEFLELGDYKDSSTRVSDYKEERYQRAESMLDQGKFEDAENIFLELGDYKDSSTRVSDYKEEQYQLAESMLAEGKYEDALQIFNKLGEYLDSKDKAEEVMPKVLHQQLMDAQIGEYIEFGNDENGKKIQWKVLDKKDEMSFYVINTLDTRKSARGRRIEDYHFEDGELDSFLKKSLKYWKSSGNGQLVMKNLKESELDIFPPLADYTERVCFSYTKQCELIYFFGHIRNSLAHGRFNVVGTKKDPIIIMEDKNSSGKIISFKLNEYGDVPIAFTSADELSIKYKVDDVVFEYSLGGTAPSSDLVMDIVSTGDLTPKSNELFFQQLCRGKDIKCIIRIGHSQYNFNIKGEGIKNACVEAGIIPFEAIDISSIEGCLQALKAKQQRDEVELYLVNSHSNFDRLSNDEIISAFTNSKWIMYGKLGGEGESAEFSENMVSGTFLDRALRDHKNWSAKNDMLEAYGLEYEVYHVEENYYLLYVDKTHTSIIAEKVNN